MSGRGRAVGAGAELTLLADLECYPDRRNVIRMCLWLAVRLMAIEVARWIRKGP